MARLNKTTRDTLGTRLERQLPSHWRVTVGAKGYAFIEIDQDGKCPPHQYHAVGSAVIVVGNGDKGVVEANRYERVPHPPGYSEGRVHHSVVAKVNGRQWADKLVDAVVTAAVEADAMIATTVAAEA